MRLSRKAIKHKKLNENGLQATWEHALPEDAESRIQNAFEMLLGEEFGLTNQQVTAVDRSAVEDYNRDRGILP